MVYHPRPVSEPPSARDFSVRALAVAALAVSAFAPAALGGFVYDDRWTVARNPWLDAPLRTLASAALAGTAQARGIPDAARPAMVVSLWVDRHLFGLRPLGYHLHSLVLYAAVTVAAWFAACSLIRDRRAAALAAAFFAMAPLHAEVVSAVNYREDLIAAIGVLVPLAWLFRTSPSEDGLDAATGVAASFAWGLLGKESAAMLLPLLLLSAFVLRVDRAWLRSRERTLYLLASAFILWLSWRWALTLSGDGIPRAPTQPFHTRLFDTARFVARSMLAAAVPIRPSPEYAPSSHAGPLWASSLVIVPLLIVLLSRKTRTRPFALALGIAAVAPLGASPLVGPVNPWADRYVFVGVLGGGIAAGAALSSLAGRLSPRARVTVAATLSIAFGIACWQAARVWRNERVLWTFAVQRVPESPRAWAALSRVERLDGNLDEADRLAARALALRPDDAAARVTRIYNLLARGLVTDARREIAYLDRLGGGAHPGMPRARLCAKGSEEAARACVHGN